MGKIFFDMKSFHILNLFYTIFYRYKVTDEPLEETQCITEYQCFPSLLYVADGNIIEHSERS